MANELAADVLPPGEALADELGARHWSQSDFAEILGRPPQFISEIISGKKEITRESAAQIAAALGTPPEYWLNLQNAFILWSQRQNEAKRKELEEVRLRARMNELAPMSLLRKRNLLKGETLADQEAELRDLFQIGSIKQTPRFLDAARHCNRNAGPTPVQSAWLAYAIREAVQLEVAKYDQSRTRQLAVGLSRIVVEPEKFQSLPERFAAVGVRLVYVEALPGSKLNGASFVLNEDSDQPVIALSGREKRLDRVLFTLLHETAHIVLGHVSADRLFIDEDSGHADDPQEQEADRQAGEWEIPEGLPVPPSVIRKGWIERAAKQSGVHPTVILGRLQMERYLDWRTVLAKGAPTVASYLQQWPYTEGAR